MKEIIANEKYFTKDEKIILKSLPSSFEWIARDKDGEIFVYKYRPKRFGNEFICKYSIPPTQVQVIVPQIKENVKLSLPEFTSLKTFNNIFKCVTWENSPIRFRGETLDEEKL